MQKTKDIFIQEFRGRPFAYVLQVFGVVVIVLNLWLGSKLYPLAKSIDEITTKVQAIEEDHTRFDTVILEDGKKDEEINVSLGIILTRLDDLRQRVDRIDARLAKHLGI